MEPLPSIAVTLLYILISFILIILNAFFVAAEFSIVKVRKTKLEELADKGLESARVSLLCVENIDEVLSAAQLGITIVSLALGWISENAFHNLFLAILEPFSLPHSVLRGLSVTGSFLLITGLHVVLGEQVPKLIAIQKAEKVMLLVAKPMQWTQRVFSPLLVVFSSLSQAILKILKQEEEANEAMSPDEIKLVAQESQEDGQITESEAEIIANAVTFSDKMIKEVMIHEEKVHCLNLSSSLEENIETTRIKRHSRFPLINDDFQSIIGIVHMKDAYVHLLDSESNKALEMSARQPVFMSGDLHLDEAMKIFKKRRAHLAIVTDPKTDRNVGMITMEDLLEEIVGDITDEHGN
jgi:CBS domain containing-hemolysin-like protein